MNKYILIILLVIVSVSSIIIAQDFDEGFKLIQGENIINLSFDFNPIYVQDLIKNYPEIATITYNDGYNKFGYVNVFGGIGNNFVIYPNQIYEITTKQEINLKLK